MSILSDQDIIKLVHEQDIIHPFFPGQVNHKFGLEHSVNPDNGGMDVLYKANKIISFGLSSYA